MDMEQEPKTDARIGIHDVADALNVSVSTAYIIMHNGVIKPENTKRPVCFTKDEVNRVKGLKERYLSMTKAAEFMGVTRTCVYNWVDKGLLHVVTPFKTASIDIRELENLKYARTVVKDSEHVAYSDSVSSIKEMIENTDNDEGYSLDDIQEAIDNGTAEIEGADEYEDFLVMNR